MEPPRAAPEAAAHPIIVFDGHCNLCNGWVSFILSHDRRQRFRFATLQGPAGQEITRAALRNRTGESIVLVHRGRTHIKSGAAIRILKLLGLPWSAAQVLLVVPRPLRDLVYDVIARNRYHWFGRRAECRLPSAEERERFL